MKENSTADGAYHINQRNEGIDLGGVSGALMATQNMQMQTFVTRNNADGPIAFAANQRDEVRNLHDVAGALGAQQGMKQQTFIAEPEPVLCLNDQGGQFMACSTDITGTLRAQMNQHQPLILESNQNHARVRSDGVTPALPASMGMGGGYVPMVYENHGSDSRYTGPHSVSPTISTQGGTGGNNLPLVEQENSVYCIVGNVIDRQPENGGNGCGYQKDISYTLTATDHHAIAEPYQEKVGALCKGDEKGAGNQYVSQDKCVVDPVVSGDQLLIRRLTPLECERLQGYPDGWTNIKEASDSARYKALGNSVAIPCVEYVMRGIASVLRNVRRRRVWIVMVIQPIEQRNAGI